MYKIPFCKQCKYFGGRIKENGVWKGICNYGKGGKWEHILDDNNWCMNGERKEK